MSSSQTSLSGAPKQLKSKQSSLFSQSSMSAESGAAAAGVTVAGAAAATSSSNSKPSSSLLDTSPTFSQQPPLTNLKTQHLANHETVESPYGDYTSSGINNSSGYPFPSTHDDDDDDDRHVSMGMGNMGLGSPGSFGGADMDYDPAESRRMSKPPPADLMAMKAAMLGEKSGAGVATGTGSPAGSLGSFPDALGGNAWADDDSTQAWGS
jgi:hypothetical protein